MSSEAIGSSHPHPSKDKLDPRGRAEVQGGYFTPEPSLGPDTARNEADKARQAVVTQAEQAQSSQSRPKSDVEAHSENRSNTDNGSTAPKYPPNPSVSEDLGDKGALVPTSKENQPANDSAAPTPNPSISEDLSDKGALISTSKENQPANGSAALSDKGALISTNKEKNLAKGNGKKSTKSKEKSVGTAKAIASPEAEATGAATSEENSDSLFVPSTETPKKAQQPRNTKDQTAKNGGNDKEGKGEKSWTDKQEQAVIRVLQERPNFYYKILGLNDFRDAERVPGAYKRLALQVHPDKNRHPKAKEAFTRVKAAAEALGVTEDIEAGESFVDHNGVEIDPDEQSDGDTTDSDAEEEKTKENVDLQGDTTMGEEDADTVAQSIEIDETAQGRSTTNQSENTQSTPANEFTPATQFTPTTQFTSTTQFTPTNQPGNTQSTSAENGSQHTQSKPTDVEWPWTTGLTAEGERIMAYRTHGRGHRCVVETEPGVPIFKIQSGVSCGKFQVEQYLNQAGIKQLSPPKMRRDWSFRHRKNFRGLEWLGISDYGTHNPYSKTGRRKDPESWCGAVWDWGREELPTSDLRKVLSVTSADAEIRKLCGKYGRTPPMDLAPEFELTKAPKSGIHKEKDYAVNENLGDGEFKVPVFKRDIDSPTESAIETALAKMNERLASMEAKLSKVDRLEEDTITPLALIVKQLVEKVGLGGNS